MLCDFRRPKKPIPGLAEAALRAGRVLDRMLYATRTAEDSVACKHPTLMASLKRRPRRFKVATLGIMREKPGCGCARRRQKLNERFTVAVPNWLYRLWRRMQK